MRPLFSPVQQRLLGLLFGQPGRRYQSAEIIRLAGSGTGAAHRQLQQLAAAGLISVTRVGNQKFYQANRASPIFAELHSIALKTSGLAGPLRAALQPLASQIQSAFVFGSIATGTDRAESDLDLLVISDTLTYGEVYEALQGAERLLARPINPTVSSAREWEEKRAVPGSFAARISAGPKLMILGAVDAGAGT
jgi:predicted nucleotidyltransferase